MNTSEIKILDIVFFNRNKNYGAYVLRKNYNQTLAKSLIIALFLFASILFICSFFNINHPIIHSKKIVPTKPLDPKTIVFFNDKPASGSVKPNSKKIKNDAYKFVEKKEFPNNKKINEEKTNENQSAGTSGNTRVGIDSGTSVRTSNQFPPQQPEIIYGMNDVEKIAEFNGNLYTFLQQNLEVPNEISAGEMHTVKIRFIIDKQGNISNADIYKSGGKIFDEEALRVVNLMPGWTPGKQGGRPVMMQFIIPISFIGE